MKRIAFHTLGCKVNQYDTQAMRELFERAGYQAVEFSEDADVYLVNTCTVTGTGDSKSMKLIRRVHRMHPGADVIVCGCLAQRDSARVMLEGVALVLGVKHRGQVVELYERAVLRGVQVNAVAEDPSEWSFEPLRVSRHEGKTRAVMKIQEGCDRYCAYCIIPFVRGPVRSMPLDEVRAEAKRLSEQGYRELVLTGIHLASFGRGLSEPCSLIDAIRAVHELPGVDRIRLGSLEPPLITKTFVESLKGLYKVCPQFHLSMQSGSAGVLARMRRRYTPQQYQEAAELLKAAYDHCAITTDVLTGFPGETDEEARETIEFVERIGFSRIHVFPYSRRAGTVADGLPDQVPEPVKQQRAAELIALGNQLERDFVKDLVGTTQQVLFEQQGKHGVCEGYSTQYVRVFAQAEPGDLCRVLIQSAAGENAYGVLIPQTEQIHEKTDDPKVKGSAAIE